MIQSSTLRGCTFSRYSKGFTLVELLITVLIIGILTSLALPQYQRAIAKTRAMEAVQATETLVKAIDLLHLKSPRMGLKSGNALYEQFDVDVSSYIRSPRLDFDEDVVYSGSGSGNRFYSTIKVGVVNYTDDYVLDTRHPVGTSWQRRCIYETAFGKKICDGLKTLGYTPQDGASVYS